MQMQEELPTTEERICYTEKETWGLFPGDFLFVECVCLFVLYYMHVVFCGSNSGFFLIILFSPLCSWPGKLGPLRQHVAPSKDWLDIMIWILWEKCNWWILKYKRYIFTSETKKKERKGRTVVGLIGDTLLQHISFVLKVECNEMLWKFFFF